MKKKNTLFFIFLTALLVTIIIFPEKFINAGLNGISAWAFNVLPAVLPFMIISQLLISTSLIEKCTKPFAKPFTKLYRTNSLSAYVFFISIVSGYPVGSKLIADLFTQGKISQTDAYRMSSFCSNSGPMFIVGAVGIGMLKSAMAGYIILISHILSAFINGIFYRKMKSKEISLPTKSLNQENTSFGDIIENSCKSILNVGTIIMFFFIVIEFISFFISFLPPTIQSFIFGIIEITKGCHVISSSFSLPVATILSTMIITFGGISTALQSVSLLNKVKMPLKTFLLQKATQCAVSGFIAAILTAIIL